MKLKKPGRLLLLALLLCSGIFACVEPYDLDYSLTKKILIVDGLLTDNVLRGPQSINLRESIPSGANSFFQPITGAVVEVVVNDKTRYRFSENGKGTYHPGFEVVNGQPVQKSVPIIANDTYRLEFSTTDGRSYRSADEQFKPINPITNVYSKLEVEGIPLSIGYEPAHYIYLDTNDPPGNGNNYVWSWSLYERQAVCESCTNGRYFIDRRNGDGCRDESTPFQEEIFFNDYQCDGPCWQIFKNSTINAQTDTYIDGQPIIGRLIAKIPVYQRSGALIDIRMQSVSTSAFRYLKLLTEQSQSNGGLADTPPAPLIGNVTNTGNPTEIVGGYFMVASEKTQVLWIDRKDANDQNVKIRGLLGRALSLEAAGNDPARPPLVPCKFSSSRTPTKPRGWVD